MHVVNWQKMSDPQALPVTTAVNTTVMLAGTSADMVLNVAKLIS